jgi:hypothetical protein
MLKFGKSAQKKNDISTHASSNTVGIYLRQLRTVYNDAIGQGYNVPQNLDRQDN